MVLGITTRSDAAKMLPDYNEALEIDNLNRKLLRFGAVNGVFDETPRGGKTAIVVWLDLLQRINDFTHLLASVADERGLNQTISRDIQQATPYDNLPATVAVQSLRAQNGKVFAYRYSYNPFEMVVHISMHALQAISTAFASGNNDADKVRKMRDAARATNQSGAVRLVNFNYRTNTWLAYNLERKPQHQVHLLVQGNEELIKKSNVTLRFDEFYFTTHNPDPLLQNIPSQGVLDESQRYTFVGLLGRQMLRDEVNRVLLTNNAVVINGVTYRPVMRNGSLVCESNRESLTAIANTIGKPILPPRGCLLRPEGWAVNEARWVTEYRTNPCPRTAQPLIDRYEFTGEPREQLQQLTVRNPLAAF